MLIDQGEWVAGGIEGGEHSAGGGESGEVRQVGGLALVTACHQGEWVIGVGKEVKSWLVMVRWRGEEAPSRISGKRTLHLEARL